MDGPERVHSQVIYPNLIAFYPRVFIKADAQLSIECIRAYNDFLSEFCSADPNRLIPIANVPWWNLDAAVVELERCFEMGHRGLNFGWQFERLGFPPLRDDHWHPLVKRAEEMGLSLNFHCGVNTEDFDLDGVRALSELDLMAYGAKFFLGNAHCVVELIVGKICHRYPKLNFVSVESGVGFLPHLVEALDWQFRYGNATERHPGMLLRPSTSSVRSSAPFGSRRAWRRWRNAIRTTSCSRPTIHTVERVSHLQRAGQM